MNDNNPLIKARNTDRIISKTAEIYELLKREQREERRMKVSTKRQSFYSAAVSGADGIGAHVTVEQAAATKEAYDNVVNELSNIFAKTSSFTPSTVKASRAAAAFFNSKQSKKPEEPENNTPTPTKRI